MSDRKYNYCILLFLIAIIAVIIATGNIGNFINEKMFIYTYISLGLLVIFFVREIFSDEHGSNRIKILNLICFVFLIFGIIAYNGNLSQEYLNFIKNNRDGRTTKMVVNSKPSVVDNKQQEIENAKKEEVVINDENYISTLNDMYEHIDNYVGRKIKVQGQIFKSENMKDNEIAIGKYYMYCCAVDMSLTGFMINKDDNFKLVENSWYDIEAVISSHKYEMGPGQIIDEPILKIIDYKEIEKPANTLVY
nr:TIGR03943 family protein [Clostridiales bacterium]